MKWSFLIFSILFLIVLVDAKIDNQFKECPSNQVVDSVDFKTGIISCSSKTTPNTTVFGAVFDQSLNTTDAVKFKNLTIHNNITIYNTGYGGNIFYGKDTYTSFYGGNFSFGQLTAPIDKITFRGNTTFASLGYYPTERLQIINRHVDIGTFDHNVVEFRGYTDDRVNNPMFVFNSISTGGDGAFDLIQLQDNGVKKFSVNKYGSMALLSNLDVTGYIFSHVGSLRTQFGVANTSSANIGGIYTGAVTPSAGYQVMGYMWNAEKVFFPNNNMVGIGTVNPVYPLDVRKDVSDISIYASKNISATGFITRTSVYDKTEGEALDKIKDASELTTSGKADDSKFYGYTTWKSQDLTRPVTIRKCEEVETKLEGIKTYCFDDVIYPYETTNEGVSLDAEINLLRQAVYELKIKVEELEKK